MTAPGQGGRWREGARADLSPTPPVVPPSYPCPTFELDDHSDRDIAGGGGFGPTWYTRFGNPTVAWAADGRGAAGGRPGGGDDQQRDGAIATALVSLCRAGDRIVAARGLYGDTRDLLVRDLPALGIRVDFVAAADLGQGRRRWRLGRAAVADAESLSNPQRRGLDIPAVAELAHRRGARLVVDNPFASALWVGPLGLGADVVVHSATKFLNGHADVVAGAVVADPGTVREVRRRVVTFGTCLDLTPRSWLPGRCPPPSRVLAGRLRPRPASPAGWRAHRRPPRSTSRGWRPTRRWPWPNGPGGPGVGAMVALVVGGGNDRAARCLGVLNLVREATSLGGVETPISAPHNSSQVSYTTRELELAGIRPGLVRLSVGLEDPAELLADLDQALQRTAPPAAAERT